MLRSVLRKKEEAGKWCTDSKKITAVAKHYGFGRRTTVEFEMITELFWKGPCPVIFYGK